MRVLIVHPHMSIYGGAEVVVARLAKFLTKKGIENKILTLSYSSQLNDLKGLNVVTLNRNVPPRIRSESFFSALGTLDEIFALHSLVRRHVNSYDLVNVHNFPATWSIAYCRKPCVWMCNEPPDLWGNIRPSLQLKFLRNVGIIIDKFIIRNNIDVICVADDFNAKRVLQRYGKIPEIIPYGIDYEFFSLKEINEGPVHERFGLSCEDFILLQVGWLSPAKNQLESVKAVERLKEAIPNIRLLLVGAGVGSYERVLRRYVCEKSLQSYVKFLGFQPREVIRDLYHISDIIVHPVKEQGGWLTPFEALCAAKPIVVSHQMTAADIIKKENIGVVTDDLVSAILQIYRSPKEYRRMGLKGQCYVAENLSWESFGRRMLSLFERVLSTHK